MPLFVIACPIDLGCPRVSLFSSTSFVVFGAFASMEDKNPQTSFQISLKIRDQKTKLHLFLQKVLHCVITHQTKYSEPFLDVFSCVWHFCLHDKQLSQFTENTSHCYCFQNFMTHSVPDGTM